MAANNLTQTQLQQLRDLQASGNTADAWNLLSQWGDTYADNAYDVVARPDTPEGNFYGTLVENHWNNTAGPGAYETYFDLVANQHLSNYLDNMNSGQWPSSREIEQSYRDAVTFYDLPPETAFDGTFTSTIGDLTNGWVDWYDALGMEESRIDRNSTVFDDLNTFEQWQVLLDNIWQTFSDEPASVPYVTDQVFGGPLSSIFEWLWDNTQLDEWGEWLGGKIYDLVNGNFLSAEVWRPPVDPLAFDLNGDGIETLAENGNNGVLFDHEGNGVKTATGWIAPDDGFLVYDRNGNGVIDNGTELFGDNTALNAGGTAANGFEALADFDTNADGVVDANDANFAGLRIWQDINSDGISQASELLTLAQAGVASINTAYEDSSIAQNGNVISGLGSYTRTDGTSSSIGSATSLVNLDLATSSFYSAFTDSIPVTAEAALLPTMNGSGMVRNIQEAASLDAGFSSALASYANATTRGEQKALLDDLIAKWSETSTMSTMVERALAA